MLKSWISFAALSEKRKIINIGIFKFLDSTKTGIRILCFGPKSERCFIPSFYGWKSDTGTLTSGSTSIAGAVPGVGQWCLWALLSARAGVAVWTSSWMSYRGRTCLYRQCKFCTVGNHHIRGSTGQCWALLAC